MDPGKNQHDKGETESNPALHRALKLTAAVAVLGSSLGVDVQKLFAAALDTLSSDLDIQLDSFKFSSNGDKSSAILLDFTFNQVNLNPSTDISKVFDSLGNPLVGEYKTVFTGEEISNAKKYLPPDTTFPNPDLLVIFPDNGAGISPNTPFFIPNSSFPTIGDPTTDYTFLTLGIQSIDYNFVPDGNGGISGLNITGVQPSGVPEPASLLIMGSGFAGLAWARKKELQRRKRSDR